MFNTQMLMDDDLPFVRKEIENTIGRRQFEEDAEFRQRMKNGKSLAEVALCIEIEQGVRPVSSYKEMTWYSHSGPKYGYGRG